LQANEARIATVVRVRDGHRRRQFAGMRGTVRHLWGPSEHAAVDVLLEDGRSELFWLSDLSVVDEDIAAVKFSGFMLVRHESIDGHNEYWLPFGYYLERDADLLMLRRSGGSLVAAFSALGVDPFEVELTA
jgi:hypothetical protein